MLGNRLLSFLSLQQNTQNEALKPKKVCFSVPPVTSGLGPRVKKDITTKAPSKQKCPSSWWPRQNENPGTKYTLQGCALKDLLPLNRSHLTIFLPSQKKLKFFFLNLS